MQTNINGALSARDFLWRFADPGPYLKYLHAPVNLPGGWAVIAADSTQPENRAWLKVFYGDNVPIIACDRRLVISLIEKRFRRTFARAAVSELLEHEPELSASTIITRGQRVAFACLLGVLAFACCIAPRLSSVAITTLLCALFMANGLFRILLLWAGAGRKDADRGRAAPTPDNELPTYTILVPLYRESHMIPSLVRALSKLDYPAERLDIKLIVEQDDNETALAADIAASAPRFSVVRVPPGYPRTKPRACNYALPFALGEFTVIFDAEDQPEPDQLRKAVAAFRAYPDSVACLQARLNFYNATENWLTCMSALDYALWFDHLLPGLDRLDTPMPLGGTSNHFRTAALRAIHGWDPYNVTEDADLGIRLARLGLRVRILDSTTFEEAPRRIGPWLLQRSRWLKGYMQTWLVHMRSPRRLLRNAGVAGFIGFQLFIAGTFLSALLNPVLWGVFAFSYVFDLSAPGESEVVAQASLFGLAAGNTLFAYLAVIGPVRRGWLALAPYGLTAPLYWLLVSCAGIRALIQLCLRPWHWDKTPHGLSEMSGAFSKVGA